GATPVTITTQNGTGTMTVSGTMKIGASGDASGATTTLDAANRSWTISGSGTGSSAPFQILASPAGTLTANTSTFNFTGSATTDVQSATYYKLVINHSGVTFNAGGGISANSDLSVTAGTFALAGNNLTVGSSGVTNSGTVAVAGTLTQTASGTTTVLTSSGGAATVGGAGTLTFYNLSFLPTGASASTFTL